MKLPGRGMSWTHFFKALRVEMAEDKVGDLAAAVTFSGILALFPFLLFLVSLASVIIDPGQAEQLVDQLARVAPPQVTEILGQRIRHLGRSDDVGLLGLGALGALWAASGGMMALMRALNDAYDVEEGRPWWKVRGIALLMVLVTSLLGVLATAAVVAVPPVAERLGGPVGTALVWLRLPFAGLVMMLVWALLYHALPDVEQRFKFITPGSVFGVLVWLIASWGFSLYVTNFGKYDATYGSLGGIIVLLLWMSISAQVLLVGAEVNAIIEHESPEGKRQGAKDKEDTGATPHPEERGGDGEVREDRPPAARPAQARPGHLEEEGPALAALREGSLPPRGFGVRVPGKAPGHRRTLTALAGVAAGALVLRLRQRGETLH